jgi:hypothetical protein
MRDRLLLLCAGFQPAQQPMRKYRISQQTPHSRSRARRARHREKGLLCLPLGARKMVAAREEARM